MEPTPTDTPDLAPPTEPGQGDPLPQRPAVWPTVVGIVAIAFGGGGVLLHGSYAVMNLLMPSAVAGLSSQGDAGVEAVIIHHAPVQGMLSLLQLALAALLLAVGIGIVRRRPRAVIWARVWAIARIASVVAVAVFTAMLQVEQLEAIATSGGGPGMPAGFIGIFVLLVAVMIVLWGCALPGFLLIWLRLRFVQAEVATWRPAAGSGRRRPAA